MDELRQFRQNLHDYVDIHDHIDMVPYLATSKFTHLERDYYENGKWNLLRKELQNRLNEFIKTATKGIIEEAFEYMDYVPTQQDLTSSEENKYYHSAKNILLNQLMQKCVDNDSTLNIHAIYKLTITKEDTESITWSINNCYADEHYDGLEAKGITNIIHDIKDVLPKTEPKFQNYLHTTYALSLELNIPIAIPDWQEHKDPKFDGRNVSWYIVADTTKIECLKTQKTRHKEIRQIGKPKNPSGGLSKQEPNTLYIFLH